MKIYDGNIAYLDTGDVLTTEKTNNLKKLSEAELLFGTMRNMIDREKQLHKIMLENISVDTGVSIDDYTWDGSGD